MWQYHTITLYFANKFSGLLIALNSKLFPDGSLKNIVHCSPGWPMNLKCGSTINDIWLSFNRFDKSWNSLIVNTNPKCGTGTSSPSTGL